MKLEIESINIENLQEGADTCVKDRVLLVNFEELESHLLEDSRLKSVDLALVSPGDRVRIVNLMDVVQPRCKIDNPDADFPGFIGKIQTAGKGKTRSLNGVTVMVSNPDTKRHYSAFFDMAGVGADMSRYGKMHHVSISPHMADDVLERDFEDAVKIAGFKTAVYLARSAQGHPVDEVEIFDLDMANLENEKGLPKVAYYYQLYSPQHDHMAISDPCFYGTEIRNLLPTVLHPNEILDGGVVGHHTIRALDTYSIQNHAIIKELYRRHNKELIFCGVVGGVMVMEPVARARKAMMASSLIKNVLGADGVVLTKIHGGLPHVDLGLVAEECEKLNVRTAVYIQPLISTGTLQEALLFNDPSLNLIVGVGATLERVSLPLAAEKFLGGTAETKMYCPDPIMQRAGDSVINSEQFILAGVHDHCGGAKICVKEY